MMKSLESMVGAHLKIFSPVHVAMVHQMPSSEKMSSRTQRKPFLRTSGPQMDSLKAQEMSAMTIHLIFYLPDIFTTFGAPKV